MGNDLNDAEIVRSIISLGTILRLEVVAEGVKTDTQFMLLKQYGCHMFQGYLFAKALPVADIKAMVCCDKTA